MSPWLGLRALKTLYFHFCKVIKKSDLVSSPLALEATELVSELVTQVALELINNYLILVQQKLHFFHATTTTNDEIFL